MLLSNRRSIILGLGQVLAKSEGNPLTWKYQVVAECLLLATKVLKKVARTNTEYLSILELYLLHMYIYQAYSSITTYLIVRIDKKNYGSKKYMHITL